MKISCLRRLEGVYLKIVHQAFGLFLYLPGVHFRGELQHGGDVSQQKINCRPIKTSEIGGVSLSDVLYVTTDCHTQIRKYMTEKEPGLNHHFDVWHFVKNKKKLIY